MLNLAKLNIFVLTLLFSNGAKAQIKLGLWSTGCRDGLKKEQFYDPHHRVNSTESFYQDRLCTNESFRFQTIGLVQYPKSSENFIDFIYEEIYLTVFKQNVISDFNERKACGLNNWVLAQAQNITGLKCAIFNLNKPTQIPSRGKVNYGIFRTLSITLHFGKLSKELDASSPEKRPTRLDLATEYIFQN